MAEIKNPHDVFFKATFSKLNLATEFFRFYLPSDVVKLLDIERIELVKGSFIDKRLKQHFSDLLFSVGLKGGGEMFIYILLEHKSAPDEKVALQLMRYLARIWERSLFDGDETLPPVIPVVVYHGHEKWRVKTNFGALFGTNKEIKVFRNYLPEFHYHLCDLSEYTDKELTRRGGTSS